jgi:cob(I)alamin adenosyltransferase
LKIYTKTGDKGDTSLANGVRIHKSSLRIEAYGTVDELNAHIAHLRDFLLTHTCSHELYNAVLSSLFRVQEELFEVGAELALAPLAKNSKHIDSQSTIILEKEIDSIWSKIPPLKNFVLPGGHLANSQAHICRCVCRRSERILFLLHEQETIRHELLVYFNRLSDWLFSISRIIHKFYEFDELFWKAKSQKQS